MISTCDKHVREDLLFSLSLLPLHLPRSGGGACDDFQVGSRGAFLSPPPFLLAEGGPHPRPRSLAMALSKAEFGGRSSVRVVVAGDLNTGKSSLIVSAATESFPENVPAVVPPTRLPADYYPDRVPVTIIDTSSRLLSSANSPVSVFFYGFLGEFAAGLSDILGDSVFVCFCSCFREEHRSSLVSECQKADAIVLTYACDRPSTLERLKTYWLPELRRLDVCSRIPSSVFRLSYFSNFLISVEFSWVLFRKFDLS